MLQITRGIELALDTQTQTLQLQPSHDLSLKRVPLTLWLTFENTEEDASGMVVNVSRIKQALQTCLQTEPVKIQSVNDLLNWAWERMQNAFPHCRLTNLRIQLHPGPQIEKNEKDKNMLTITTQYELAAAHQLWNPQWSKQKNIDMYGKCANPSGHGHNYKIDITLTGQPDTDTGRIADPKLIDQIVKQKILDPFDHQNLNQDTKEFKNLVPTVENMARTFWLLLQNDFHPATLHRIRIWETDRTYAEYAGPPDQNTA